MLDLEVDVSKFDLDKIVVDGQIVDQVEVRNRELSSTPVLDAQHKALDLAALDCLLNEDDEPEAQPERIAEQIVDSEVTP